MASRKNAFESIVEQCEEMGWRVKPTRRGWQILPPGGAAPVSIGGTHDGKSALRNATTALNRAGFGESWAAFTEGARRAARRACTADQATGA